MILYGAGKYAETVLLKVRALGMEPVCFCDTDTNKWGTSHLGLSVGGLEQTIEKYPDFIIVIATAPHRSHGIYLYLTEEMHIPPERFPFHRLSCGLLEGSIVDVIDFYGEESLMYCCGGTDQNLSLRIPMGKNVSESLATFFDVRKQVIADTHAGVQNMCTDCPSWVWADWLPQKGFSSIVLADEYAPCQCSCIYCRQAVMKHSIARLSTGPIASHFPQLLAHLRENGLIASDAICRIAPAEITIHPQRNDILDAAIGLRQDILTNAILFDSRLADSISIPGNQMLLSIDAGTRETYSRVKGVDAFDRVRENIRRYRDWGNGGKIALKYIMLPENKDDADLIGFINLAIEMEIDTVVIARDNSLKMEKIDEEIINAIRKMVDMAYDRGITPSTPGFPPMNQVGKLK